MMLKLRDYQIIREFLSIPTDGVTTLAPKVCQQIIGFPAKIHTSIILILRKTKLRLLRKTKSTTKGLLRKSKLRRLFDGKSYFGNRSLLIITIPSTESNGMLKRKSAIVQTQNSKEEMQK